MPSRATTDGAATIATDPQIRVLDRSDIRAATALLARGFAEEPGNVALLPDPGTRRVLLEAAIHATLSTVVPYRTVQAAVVDGELAAVAIWHPPGVPTASVGVGLGTLVGLAGHPMAVARALPHATATVLRHAREGRALTRERRAAAARASAGASWHLAFLATAPEHRGRGLARALLERQLRRCDEDGAPAWLETTDPVNPPVYERFGFVTMHHVGDAAWLPGFWMMRREPQPP